MNNIQKRFLLFIFGCILVRSLLVYVTKIINKNYLKYFAYVAIIIGISFLYLFLTSSRKTGPEVFGDKIWWNNLRPIHGILYLLFAYFALSKYYKKAWIFLLIDVIIGLMSFLIFHYNEGNFKILLNK